MGTAHMQSQPEDTFRAFTGQGWRLGSDEEIVKLDNLAADRIEPVPDDSQDGSFFIDSQGIPTPLPDVSSSSGGGSSGDHMQQYHYHRALIAC